MASLDDIFKAYDVRGVVPDQLDAATCEAIGAAFARFAVEQPGPSDAIVVARDMRPSGVELADAFSRGIQSQGVDVVDIGLASTDMLFFASGRLDAPGATLTASHNPSQYNGIKLCLSGAKPIGEDSGLSEIKEMARQQLPAVGEPGTRTERDLLDDFATHIRSFVDVGKLRPLRIVADTANGMGGLVAPAVFAGLPFDVEILYGELDGTFPNHPADPIQVENLRDLRDRVLEVGADIGLAFDGDADRVFLVDEQAEPVPGSLTTSIVAASVLEREPGATILHNLICSKAVPEVIEESGGKPIRTRVGHSIIKGVMADTGAAFGGEHSGHYYFRDNFRADSGLIAALIVLERLSVANQPLSELRRPFERYVASGEINTQVDDVHAVIDQVAEHYASAEQDRLDGLTVDLGGWWFNLRPSNTEPLLRLNLEAPTQDEVDQHVAEVRSLFASS
jgi:phosphomannomutase